MSHLTLVALACIALAVLIAAAEHLLPRLHTEEWLLERALWTFDGSEGEWVASSRESADGMVPLNTEARELARRWNLPS